MPPGSGVSGPRGDRRVEHVDIDREEDRAAADGADRAPHDLLDAERANVVHEQRGDALLALPGELALTGPVAAQSDLHVAGGVHGALLDEPVHRRPVRARHAEDLGARVGVRVEVDQPDRAVLGGDGADVRLGDRVVAAEDHRDRSGGEHLGDRALDRRVARDGVGRQHRRIAEVDDAQGRKGVDARGQVAPGRAARGADRARPEARAGAVGDEIVGRRADDRDIDADKLGRILGVALTGEGEQAGEIRLLAVRSPARQRVDHRRGRYRVARCD